MNLPVFFRVEIQRSLATFKGLDGTRILTLRHVISLRVLFSCRDLFVHIHGRPIFGPPEANLQPSRCGSLILRPFCKLTAAQTFLTYFNLLNHLNPFLFLNHLNQYQNNHEPDYLTCSSGKQSKRSFMRLPRTSTSCAMGSERRTCSISEPIQEISPTFGQTASFASTM